MLQSQAPISTTKPNILYILLRVAWAHAPCLRTPSIICCLHGAVEIIDGVHLMTNGRKGEGANRRRR